MARLNQIIAVEKGIKSRSLQELTEAHHAQALVRQRHFVAQGLSIPA